MYVQMKRCVVALILVPVLTLSSVHAQKARNVVAEVGDHAITLGELRDFADSGLYHYLASDEEEALSNAMQDLITEELKRIDLFASGHAQDDTLFRRVARIVTEELGLAYAKRRYEDRYINDESIRSEHERMGTIVSYRQIVLAKPSDADADELDSLRTVTGDIQRQLEEGTSFAAIEQRYRDFVVSGSSNEPLQLTWEETVRSPRAFILFRLQPGAVRSFEGPRTFSIARVEDVERTSVAPLESVREQIVNALHQWYAEPATQAFRAEWMGLVDTLALQWNPVALEQVVAWASTPGFFEGSYRRVVEAHLAGQGDAQLLSDGRGEVRVSDLPRLIEEVLTSQSSGRHDLTFVQEYLLEALRTERLAARAREEGLLEEIWQADTPSPALARAFVQFYNEKLIDNQIPAATDARLRAFYQEFADSLFYQHERANAEVIVREDSAEIAEIWRQIQNGAAFSDVSHRRLLRSFQRGRDGTITSLFNPEPPYLGELAFGLSEGEIAGPHSYSDHEERRRFAILKVTRRLEERQLLFEEVRDRVEEAFVDHHRRRLATEIAERLRERYPVTVYPDVLTQSVAASR